MSRILVLYGTTDGHTRKVAQALGVTLGADGSRVDVINAAVAAPDLRPEDYDAVFVAASVHARGYQRAVKEWVHAHAPALNRMPTAFLSVCLGILEEDPETRRDVHRIMHRFLNRAGWYPAATEIVAGALPYTRYGWLKKFIMRRIAAKAGADTDTSQDYEYTDWAALDRFAMDFMRREGLVRDENTRGQPAPRAPVA